METRYMLLADAVLILHALIVFFNVGALPVIWLGGLRGWGFVRNFYFRMGHLVLIGLVTGETLFGAICPLTTWEDELRVKGGADPRYATGYLAHWLRRLIFYDVDERVFMVGYVLFFGLVFGTLIWVRPQVPRWARKQA